MFCLVILHVFYDKKKTTKKKTKARNQLVLAMPASGLETDYRTGAFAGRSTEIVRRLGAGAGVNVCEGGKEA